jgi:hypothetical protein
MSLKKVYKQFLITMLSLFKRPSVPMWKDFLQWPTAVVNALVHFMASFNSQGNAGIAQAQAQVQAQAEEALEQETYSHKDSEAVSGMEKYKTRKARLFAVNRHAPYRRPNGTREHRLASQVDSKTESEGGSSRMEDKKLMQEQLESQYSDSVA